MAEIVAEEDEMCFVDLPCRITAENLFPWPVLQAASGKLESSIHRFYVWDHGRRALLWTLDDLVLAIPSGAMRIRSEIEPNNNSNQSYQLIPELCHQQVECIVGGDGHRVALTRGGRVFAWGDNECGSVGIRTPSGILVESPVLVLDQVRMISAGRYHTVALCRDGSVFAWGENFFGQLGTGDLVNRAVPVRLTLHDAATRIHQLFFVGQLNQRPTCDFRSILPPKEDFILISFAVFEQYLLVLTAEGTVFRCILELNFRWEQITLPHEISHLIPGSLQSRMAVLVPRVIDASSSDQILYIWTKDQIKKTSGISLTMVFGLYNTVKDTPGLVWLTSGSNQNLSEQSFQQKEVDRITRLLKETDLK